MSSPYDGFKPAQTGLVDMGNISFYNTGATPIFNLAEVEPYGSSFSELVLNVTWAQLQPTANGPVVTSAIDSAIAQVTSGKAPLKMRNSPTKPLSPGRPSEDKIAIPIKPAKTGATERSPPKSCSPRSPSLRRSRNATKQKSAEAVSP